MKTMFMVALFATAALVGGCDQKKDEKKGDTSASSSGVKECDDYYAAVEKCMGSADEATKDAFKQGMEQFKTQVKNASDDASKQAVAQGCKAAADALKNNPACK